HLLPWWHGGPTDIDNLLLLCRYHHAKVHEGHWRIHLDSTTGELHVYRPDGRPYELAPSKPWTSPGRRTGDA
ncbi:MAG TPA: HNH endonuclease signature motif containing protein, partial [Micromonosporaceae bacterium]|nr:HNH endonuclease signature motif containing protein [Micromonosporaceae bacterium]